MNRETPIEERRDGSYRITHDMSEPGLSVTITQALLEIDGIEPIDDFRRYVDPDALDRLFGITSSGAGRHLEGSVHLEIQGIDVTVHADGEILIEV